MLRLILSGHLIFPLSLLSSSFPLLPFPFLDLSLFFFLSLSPPQPFSSQAFQKQHKTGDDCVKKKLQDLERKWEEVCQMSVERQDRLEQAYKLIGQFQSHLTPLRSWMTEVLPMSWMTEVLPMLNDSEPVHGDVDTTDAFMTAHSVSMNAHPAPNNPFSYWYLSISPPSFFPTPYPLFSFLHSSCFSLFHPTHHHHPLFFLPSPFLLPPSSSHSFSLPPSLSLPPPPQSFLRELGSYQKSVDAAIASGDRSSGKQDTG